LIPNRFYSSQVWPVSDSATRAAIISRRAPPNLKPAFSARNGLRARHLQAAIAGAAGFV
jgi:hypothetical protein